MKQARFIIAMVFVFAMGYCSGTEAEHAEAVRRYRHYEQQIEELSTRIRLLMAPVYGDEVENDLP